MKAFKNRAVKRDGLRKIFGATIESPLNLYSAFLRLKISELKVPRVYTFISILTGEQYKIFFDLLPLTATVRVRMVPSVLTRTFAVLWKKSKLFQKIRTKTIFISGEVAKSIRKRNSSNK